ncbi:MAG: DUF1214 domain-containing protein [Desulfobaccales bacterium]|jgi:hypothetical protein
MLIRPRHGFVLFSLVIMTKLAIAQEREGTIPSLIKPADAVARMDAEQARETEAYTLGVQTVLWGMQWVKAGQTMRVAAAPLPQGTKGIPVDPSPHGINVWGHARALLTHELRIIETPNTETLYSIAILDLKDGPIVVVHPDLGERYFRTSIWELHGDAHSISQKKDGAKPPPYALVPSGWNGALPKGLKAISVRSRYVAVVPHIAVYGTDDLPNVHVLQKGFKLVALKDWGSSNKELEPGQPMRPLRRPNTATPAELLFFEELCETLKDITPRDDELGFARQAGRIGITLADGFQVEKLDAKTVAGLKRAVLDAQSIIEHKARSLAQQQPGGTWMVSYDLASLDDWLFRSAVGWKHVSGDLPSEVLFPMVRTDVNGQPLTGNRKYTLHFHTGQLPPARYWRISMYDLDGFFVGNPIRRYGIGNMAEKLKPNPDGSLTIYIQNESPGKAKEVNWLPAPKEGFFLMMRMYQPEEKMYRGAYVLPPLQEVK